MLLTSLLPYSTNVAYIHAHILIVLPAPFRLPIYPMIGTHLVAIQRTSRTPTHILRYHPALLRRSHLAHPLRGFHCSASFAVRPPYCCPPSFVFPASPLAFRCSRMPYVPLVSMTIHSASLMLPTRLTSPTLLFAHFYHLRHATACPLTPFPFPRISPSLGLSLPWASLTTSYFLAPSLAPFAFQLTTAWFFGFDLPCRCVAILFCSYTICCLCHGIIITL